MKLGNTNQCGELMKKRIDLFSILGLTTTLAVAVIVLAMLLWKQW